MTSTIKHPLGKSVFSQVPAVLEAIRQYQEAHGLLAGEQPALSIVIDWLVSEGDNRVADLADRLGWIAGILADCGDVLPDDRVELPGTDVLLIRIFADTS